MSTKTKFKLELDEKFVCVIDNALLLAFRTAGEKHSLIYRRYWQLFRSLTEDLKKEINK